MTTLDEKPLNSSSTENLPLSNAPPALHLMCEKDVGLNAPNGDFDPCQNAKPCSPFYNHDTPRGSMDFPKKPSLHVMVRDLEAQNSLTPSQSADVRASSGPEQQGTLRPWKTGPSLFSSRRKSPCLTKPKPRGCQCLSNLPKRQKLCVKLVIALVIVGAMVGIAVGISLKVGGEVYKDENSTSKIGDV